MAQSDILPLTYGRPFIYPQQNYNLLCMLQNINQNLPISQSGIWMTKPPEIIQKAHSIETIQPLQRNCEILPIKAFSVDGDPDSGSNIIKRVKFLPPTLKASITQEEHPHYHNEFCDYCTIRHDGHIDYIYDAELHCVDAIGSNFIII